jgi:hypothetical protein
MSNTVTWKWVRESLFPLLVQEASQAGIDTTGWCWYEVGNLAWRDPETGGVHILYRFNSPTDAESRIQGMRDAWSLQQERKGVFTLEIDTANAAFANAALEDDPGPEVARILRSIADKIDEDRIGGAPVPLRDINGNTVGTCQFR